MFYELMKIVNPDIREDTVEKVIGRFQNNVKKNGGEVIRIEDMGIKTMAYKIQKKTRGHYFLSYLEGPGSMLSEIERTLRIDENVIRFIIIKLDEHVKREDLEKAVLAPSQEADNEVKAEGSLENESGIQPEGVVEPAAEQKEGE